MRCKCLLAECDSARRKRVRVKKSATAAEPPAMHPKHRNALHYNALLGTTLASTHVTGTQTLDSLRSPALWCNFESSSRYTIQTQERIGIPQRAFNVPACFSLEVACHTTLLK